MFPASQDKGLIISGKKNIGNVVEDSVVSSNAMVSGVPAVCDQTLACSRCISFISDDEMLVWCFACEINQPTSCMELDETFVSE